jgi:hypothetical protein
VNRVQYKVEYWGDLPYAKGKKQGWMMCAKGGVDILSRWESGLAGFGLFGGICGGSVGDDTKEVELTYGIRGPLGFF